MERGSPSTNPGISIDREGHQIDELLRGTIYLLRKAQDKERSDLPTDEVKKRILFK